MDEKERFLQARADELQVTQKLMWSLPLERPDFRPRPNMPSLRDLVLVFIRSELVYKGIIGDRLGRPDLSRYGTAGLAELISLYENLHNEVTDQMKDLSLEAFKEQVDFSGTMARRGDALWSVLRSVIHHRGELSVYAELAR